jgi:hypothetical protein
VSRHLAEEALNYFEECVSISTMDSTDFSSPEEHQPNLVLNVQPKSNSGFFHKGRSSFQVPHTPADQHGHHEVSELIFLFTWSFVAQVCSLSLPFVERQTKHLLNLFGYGMCCLLVRSHEIRVVPYLGSLKITALVSIDCHNTFYQKS